MDGEVDPVYGHYIDPDLLIDNIRTIYIGPEGDVEEVVVMDGDSIYSRDGWIRMGRNADDVNMVHDTANPQDEEFSYYSDWRPYDREWNINYGTGNMVMEDGEVLTREQVNERFGVDEIYDIPDPLDTGNNPNDGGAPRSITFNLAPGETALIPSPWPMGTNMSIRQFYHEAETERNATYTPWENISFDLYGGPFQGALADSLSRCCWPCGEKGSHKWSRCGSREVRTVATATKKANKRKKQHKKGRKKRRRFR